MADTGTRSPTNATGYQFSPANVYDGNDSTAAVAYAFSNQVKTYTLGGFDGDDLPIGATVNGVKVRIRARHYVVASYEAAAITSVKLSLNDGSGYSSNILSSNQNTTGTYADYEFGGASETWGLDWSGFTDISDLKVEYKSAPADGTGNHYFLSAEVDAIVYYDATETVTVSPKKIIIKSGTLSLNGGNIIIK